MNHPHDLWLRHLKKEKTVTLWGFELTFYDFISSETLDMTVRDIEEDAQGLKDLTFNDGDVILDIGANIGVISILLAKKFPNTQILAVEPMPHNIENLMLNAQTNGVTNIQVVDKALSSISKTLTLTQSPVNSGSASYLFKEDLFPRFEVPAMTFDELISSINVPEIALIKMDIEGSEHEVLGRFHQWEKIKRMTIELHAAYGETPNSSFERVKKTNRLLEENLKDRVRIVYEGQKNG